MSPITRLRSEKTLCPLVLIYPSMNDCDLAQKWACETRTIRRWRKAGAPFGSAKKMRAWLAGRKSLPHGTMAILSSQAKTRRVGVLSDASGDVKAGAPAALRRLEQAEANAYRLLQSALKNGDPLEVKNARQGWLAIGDSLRRYDLLVSASRRESGEMVQRTEVEAAVSNFMNWLRLAAIKTAGVLSARLVGLDRRDTDDILKASLFEDLVYSLGASASSGCPAKLPDWFLAAATGPLEGSFTGASDAIEARRELFEMAVEATSNAVADRVINAQQ